MECFEKQDARQMLSFLAKGMMVFNMFRQSGYYFYCILATICPGHNFPAKFVICCNGPTWKLDNAQSLLETAIINCLKLADSKNLKSLAVPSLGSGR